MSTAAKRPQLNLDELRRLKWLLGGALALVSQFTVFFLDIEALGLVAVAGTVILATILWPQLPARVPPLVWKLAVPAIIATMCADFYFSPDTLPVLIRLAMLLTLYRAVSYRGKREDLQLIVLGLFLIVVAGVLTVTLGFAFLLLLFTACALGFLFIVTLVDTVAPETAVLRPEELREAPAWTRLEWGRLFTRLRQVFDWRLLGFTAVLFAGVVGMSGLLFIIIPRFELGSSFFLDRFITRKSKTGFTERVSFGDVSELIRDESIAMRVDLTDARSVRGIPYWRLVVLDEYTPEGFRMSTAMQVELQKEQVWQQYVRGKAGLGGPHAVGGTWTIYVEPGVSRFLPLPGSFTHLRMRDIAPVQVSRRHRLVALRQDPVAMNAFQLDGVVLDEPIADIPLTNTLARTAPGSPPPSLNVLRGPAGPDNEAVLARIVVQITRGENLSASDFARRAITWLQERHAYALSSRSPPGRGDDIVRWIDSNEPGFCEYFATGLVVLCRAAGYPARVVTGFRGGVLNAYENYFMVKNSDAHAWSEVFENGAWQRFDATPGAMTSTAQAEALRAARAEDNSWDARFDSLRVLWYRRIVNFDQRAQAEMIEQVKSFTVDSGQAIRDWLNDLAKQVREWIVRPWDVRRISRTGVSVVFWGALGWALWRLLPWLRLQVRGWGRGEDFDPVRHEAGQWLRRVAARGDTRLAGVRGELQRLRYGHRGSWPAQPRSIFRQAKRELRAARG